MNKSHKNWAHLSLRIGLAATLLWSVSTKLTSTEQVVGLFNNLGLTFATPGIIIAISVGLLILSGLLITGKYLQTTGYLLTIFFLVSLISGTFAGETPFSVGPGIWKDFALLGIAGYFALGGNTANTQNIENASAETLEK